jgi:TusA-related sulfurtransferase
MADTGGKLEAKKVGENHYELDVRGLVCPYPQVLVTRALSSLSSDDVLEVIIDNPPSVRDIPPALEEGYKTDVSHPDGSTWRLLVRARD